MVHTLPNVNYLAKVRNQDEIIHEAEGQDEGETTAGGEDKKGMDHQPEQKH
jgi:hypothetical protein